MPTYKAKTHIGLTRTGPLFRAGDVIPASYPYLESLLRRGLVEPVEGGKEVGAAPLSIQSEAPTEMPSVATESPDKAAPEVAPVF